MAMVTSPNSTSYLNKVKYIKVKEIIQRQQLIHAINCKVFKPISSSPTEPIGESAHHHHTCESKSRLLPGALSLVDGGKVLSDGGDLLLKADYTRLHLLGERTVKTR